MTYLTDTLFIFFGFEGIKTEAAQSFCWSEFLRRSGTFFTKDNMERNKGNKPEMTGF